MILVVFLFGLGGGDGSGARLKTLSHVPLFPSLI